MAHARAATSIPLVRMYRLFEQRKLAAPSLFTDDPESSLLLSELAEEIAAAESLQRRDDDIAFGEFGAAPEAPPVGGCDAAAAARLTEIEAILESRGRISGVPPLPGRLAASYSPSRAPMQISPDRSRNWAAIWSMWNPYVVSHITALLQMLAPRPKRRLLPIALSHMVIRSEIESRIPDPSCLRGLHVPSRRIHRSKMLIYLSRRLSQMRGCAIKVRCS